MDASTTPDTAAHDPKASFSLSRSRNATPPPRPTTPLRPPSRNSLRSSQTPTQSGYPSTSTPLDSLEPMFAELSDSMADLEANFMHLQLMHESLSRFSECFASFLYGMNVNAFCVDFPEAPVSESFRRLATDPSFQQAATDLGLHSAGADSSADADQTFLTTDTSFVENPPATATKPLASSKYGPTAARGATSSTTTRGGRGSTATSMQGRGVAGRRGRASGLARASTRGRSGSAR